MAKDLPYFKFITAEWLTGNIAHEPFEVQGLFINICALYWQRNGVLEKDDVVLRFKKKNLIDKLSGRFFFESGRFIRIAFLDEQLTDRQSLSETNKNNGQKGGRPKKTETKADTKANETNKEKRREEKEKNKKREEEMVFPWDSENFKKWWGMWITYKLEQHKESYKSNLTQQAALKKLNELAGGVEEVACLIIEQSIANSWKGLFELKQSKNGTGANKQGKQAEFAEYFKNKSGESGNAA
jgi:hypothetical protein